MPPSVLNGPLGNSSNPIFLGDPINGNNTALLGGGTFTISRDIQILGTSGTITLGGNAAVNPTFSGNLTGAEPRSDPHRGRHSATS